jgi:acyl-CoA dehydrogenase
MPGSKAFRGLIRGQSAAVSAADRTSPREQNCGGAYFRNTGIERLLRDVHGAPYHPLQAKRQHRFAGRVALGLDPL